MISEAMQGFVQNSSAIRAMFEEGKKMAAEFGAENVYDFSLGNPNVPAPSAVGEVIVDLVQNEDPVFLHGYMNNSGYEDVRAMVAAHLNGLFKTDYEAKNILMTVGAAGGMNVFFKTILNPGDEVISFSPFFVEYRSYVGNYGGTLIEIPADAESFQPDPAALSAAINEKTKALIVNSPNNPTGAVYSEAVLKEIAQVLRDGAARIGHPIYLISDEPYRELVYGDAVVPWIPALYENTIVGYSFSKSLSLPGERIGYLVIPSCIEGFDDFAAAANVANRILGYVNAPSLMQRAVAKCLDAKTDLAYYDENRRILEATLSESGYTFVQPQGAFYLWIKSPVEDERDFVAKAKEKRILLVQGRSFGCAGWVRLAYCVSRQTVEGSLDGFREMAKEYALGR